VPIFVLHFVIHPRSYVLSLPRGIVTTNTKTVACLTESLTHNANTVTWNTEAVAHAQGPKEEEGPLVLEADKPTPLKPPGEDELGRPSIFFTRF
jgi:hypothetical protein